MKHFSVFLLLALAGLASAARKRVQTKSAANTKGDTYCKLTETPNDVQFGFNFVTKVESCVKCNPIMFFHSGGLFTDFITGSRNEADKVCECFQTNLGQAPSLMFKSRQLPKDSCDAEFCLSQYATLLRIQQEKMGFKVSGKAMLNSPNHWKRECDEVAMDQTPFPTDVELVSRIPEGENKEQAMRNLGRFAVMKTQTEAQVLAAEKATVPVMVTSVESEAVADGDDSDSIDLEPADMIGGFIYADLFTKPVRKIVQVVALGPGAGICSANSPHYASDQTSQCKEVATSQDCKEVAGMYGADFQKLDHEQSNLPSACFVRSNGDSEIVYWNSATKEHQGTKKTKSIGFEHTLLCACYKEVMPALIQLKPSVDDGL